MKAFFLAAVSAASCSTAFAQTATEAAALAQFKQIVERCAAVFEAGTAVRQGSEGKWFKQSLDGLETSFDVKKSDSIVTPYLGTLTVKYVQQGKSAPTQKEAHSLTLEPDGPMMRATDVLHFVFREGRWEGVSVEDRKELRSSAGKPFEKLTPFKRSKAELSPTGWHGKCLNLTSKA
ncbi:MAG: hypothetical protein EOP24_39445 [Hyphomicrobiales bacterium]|nr:MAG: hypothetical protein EOP24_39445 [Hyphomicrobiales bacterium]